MSPNPSYLEIHVHGVDGHAAAFVQKDAETIRKLIECSRLRTPGAPIRLLMEH